MFQLVVFVTVIPSLMILCSNKKNKLKGKRKKKKHKKMHYQDEEDDEEVASNEPQPRKSAKHQKRRKVVTRGGKLNSNVKIIANSSSPSSVQSSLESVSQVASKMKWNDSSFTGTSYFNMIKAPLKHIKGVSDYFKPPPNAKPQPPLQQADNANQSDNTVDQMQQPKSPKCTAVEANNKHKCHAMPPQGTSPGSHVANSKSSILPGSFTGGSYYNTITTKLKNIKAVSDYFKSHKKPKPSPRKSSQSKRDKEKTRRK